MRGIDYGAHSISVAEVPRASGKLHRPRRGGVT